MHAIWKGVVSFGLINIPVRLYSASRSRELKFKMLHKQDLSEIRYARICKVDGKEIPWSDIVKSYEYKNGHYVVITEEEFERAYLKKTRAIEILDFTEEHQIDSIYYDTPYYLEPEKNSSKAYALLYEALHQAKKVAVGRFIFHHHEHLGVIRVYENMLILQQLRYQSELNSTKELTIPHIKTSKKELDIALQLIDQLSSPFHPSRYFDSYTDQVKEIIKKKAKGKALSLPKTPEKKTAQVHDILSLLKSSLEKQKKRIKKRKAA